MKAAMVLLGSLVAMAMISSCSGLECYECSSLEHSACEDKFDKERAAAAKFTKVCPEPTERGYRALCRKTHQTVLGKVRIIRSCGYANSTEDCTGTRNSEVIMESCQCFTKECNSASLAQLTPIVAMVAAALRVIY